jgi:hypothetical protein
MSKNIARSLAQSLDRRKPNPIKGSALPSAFIGMVTDVFSKNFDEGLKKIKKITGDKIQFQALGEVFPEEIVLCVTLVQEKSLSATSAYASVDFDPKASTPTIQDLLPLCVDAIGAVFDPLLNTDDKTALEGLVEGPLSALNDIPFEWTLLQIDKQRIYVKMDKANPHLDKMADDWLAKHDPDLEELERQAEEESENLFITGPTGPNGPKKSGRGSGSGSLH